MSLFNVFDISGSALSAQSVRLNTIASNMANAGVVGSSPETAYHAKYPVFSAVFDEAQNNGIAVGVRVDGIVNSTVSPGKEYAPHHPSADDEGFIYLSNVNPVEEMANMISASRSYQSSVQVMETAKQLITHTLSLGN